MKMLHTNNKDLTFKLGETIIENLVGLVINGLPTRAATNGKYKINLDSKVHLLRFKPSFNNYPSKHNAGILV